MTKFYQTLNTTPRSAKHHGKHRRAGKTAYGDPIVRADHSSGGTDQSGAVTVSWGTLGTWTSWDPFPEPKPPTIPYAGIRTGELIGHRLWWLLPTGELCSLAHRETWAPGETKAGDISKAVDMWGNVWGGVYAFTDPLSIGVELETWRHEIAQFKERERCGMTYMGWGWHPFSETTTLVAGKVKMWGEVIEHETGYRAEFAKLNSIDAIYGGGDLEALRTRYGVRS